MSPAVDRWTVGAARRWIVERFKQEGIESANLDADLLLAATLGLDRLGVITRVDQPLTPPERASLRELVRRRLDREPVAYILGHRHWLDLDLAVGPGVLVPRPETEFVIDACAELDGAGDLPAGEVVDLGTGSGAIALGLSRRLGRAVLAVERSPEALSYARRNADELGDGLVTVVEGDWARGLEPGTVALAAANPPYVPDGDREGLAPELAHEPAGALFAGTDGLDVVRRLAAELPETLVPGGWWVCEVGAGQRPAIDALLAGGGWEGIRWWRDFAGHDRVFAARAMVR